VDLILDIGMHRGDDARFYLAKGFKVVSVEAFPAYVSEARVAFKQQVENGQLVIIEKAVVDNGQESVKFYVNKEKDDSHTTIEDIVKENIANKTFNYDEILVKTVTLQNLFDEYGVPYYLKCDIEGADTQVLDQLQRDHRRPKFVSFELSSSEIIKKISAAGYQSFQIINQWLNPTLKASEPAREGHYAEANFNGHSSGFFGRELPPHKWMRSDRAISLYEMWLAMQAIDPSFVIGGWADCHASMLSIDELSD
jgi:FkbM family methyltransferase